jgi:hypothetical protein
VCVPLTDRPIGVYRPLRGARFFNSSAQFSTTFSLSFVKNASDD